MDDLIQEILKYPARLVVITGGEPLMYDLTHLTGQLKEHGFRINIETSGAYSVSGQLDWICVSPKKFKAPLKEVLEKANELKCIIFNKSDFSFAEQNREHTSEKCQLYLQTEWSQQEKMLPLMVEYVKANPAWKLSLQTHKYLNIP